MSNKNLTILGIVAIVMVILAGLTSKMSDSKTVKVVADMPLVQGLNPEQIGRIVAGSGDESVEIVRKGQSFVISDKDNYPADIDKVNSLINTVLDIKVSGEALTENSENHDELEVTEKKAARMVKFFSGEGKLMTGVIVGKRLDSGQTVLRLAGNDAVRTSSGGAWFNTSANNFMDTEIVSVDKDNIVKVTVNYEGGKYAITSEPNSSEAEFAGEIPTGKQLKENEYENVFGGLGNVRFEDVMAEEKAGEMEFDESYVCRLADSTVYTFEVAEKDDDYFVKCSAEFTDLGQINIAKDESEEELKKKEAKLLARDNAAKFNGRHKGWVYKVPSYQGQKLVKPISELVEDIPEPEPADVNDVNDAGQSN